MRLRNRVALITGAGSGIGQAGARVFAEEGAAVAVVDVNRDAAQETVAQITAAGGQAIAIEADISVLEDNERAVHEVLRSFGQLNIFWANAGLTAPLTPLSVLHVDTLDRLLSVNTKGPWLGAKAAMPVLCQAPGSSFIITASLAGMTARAGGSAYSMSKGAAVMLARSLSVEFAPEVRVNSISPMSTETPMLQQLAAEGVDMASIVQSRQRGVPMGRIAWPDDVARAALFFASDDSRFITGVNLPIDGGVSART